MSTFDMCEIGGIFFSCATTSYRGNYWLSHEHYQRALYTSQLGSKVQLWFYPLSADG
jgi:hypothetical protein